MFFGIPSEIKRYFMKLDTRSLSVYSKWSDYRNHSYHLFALWYSLVSNMHYLNSIDQIINGVMW